MAQKKGISFEKKVMSQLHGRRIEKSNKQKTTISKSQNFQVTSLEVYLSPHKPRNPSLQLIHLYNLPFPDKKELSPNPHNKGRGTFLTIN